MEFNVGDVACTGGASTAAAGAAAPAAAGGTAATPAASPMPATFAGKLELATKYRSDILAACERLSAGGKPAKRVAAFIEAISTAAGGIDFAVVEDATETPVADLLASWRGPVPGLEPIDDIFNDKLDYGVDTWAQLQALADGMLRVLAKYEMFHHESPKVVAAVTAFMTNYAALHRVVSAMEARAAGDASVVEAVTADCAELAARAAAVAGKHGATIRAPSNLAVIATPPKMAALGVAPAHMLLLFSHVVVSGVAAPAFELLYQATVDGSAAADMMRKCAGKGPVLVIGREATRGWLFGGYLDCGISDEGGEVAAPGSFVFTLTNPHGLPPTAWRRGPHPLGGARSAKAVSLCWYNTLGTKAASALSWWAGEGDKWYQARGAHGRATLTGTGEWVASEVLVYRV